MGNEFAYIVTFCLIAVVLYYWLAFVIEGKRASTQSLLLPSKHAACYVPHRHSCKHCQRITISLPDNCASKQLHVFARLDLTTAEVGAAAADGCPLLRDADIASRFPIGNRLSFHCLTFTAIFTAGSPLHEFTGCTTLKARLRYFLHALSDRPIYLRIAYLNAEAGGTLYARLFCSAWKSFEFDLTADSGEIPDAVCRMAPLMFAR